MGSALAYRQLFVSLGIESDFLRKRQALFEQGSWHHINERTLGEIPEIFLIESSTLVSWPPMKLMHGYLDLQQHYHLSSSAFPIPSLYQNPHPVCLCTETALKPK